MSAPDPPSGDPLIEALPPNTDYITYLTILEYQLTPKNLPTLNRLLRDDDGTLASEIGWDLLKLVLPILRVEPSPVKECLDIISRRGNPREVIVRVSEELENLGVGDPTDEGAEPDESDDGLPTFAGEAPRVHLGDMTLKGMPPAQKLRSPPQPDAQGENGQEEQEQEQHATDVDIEELKLQSLLSMLSILHPRIKTKYPSRFLATSLPAALGAYRRLSMDSESTLAFLEALRKLSGNARPALPPRIPTADLLRQTTASTSVPLPDPESKTESNTDASQATSDNESAINKRLLQAVLLEIVEEHTTTSSEAQPPMTARLRSRFEPNTIISARRQDLDKLLSTEEAENADSLRRRFLAVANTLKLEVNTEIQKSLEPATEDPEAQEEHEYPTSPSQIPFSTTALLLLRSSLNLIQTLSQSSPAAPTTSEQSTLLQTIVNQYSSDTRLQQSGPALDCILSLLYTTICVHQDLSAAERTQIASPISEDLLLATFSLLKDVFTTCPDADLRDNAHHIATHLLHGRLQPITRIAVIRELLNTSSTESALSPIHEAQSGNLQALAINWLKNEIYPTQATLAITAHSSNPPQDRGLPSTTLLDLADDIFSTTSMPSVPNRSTASPPQPDQDAITTATSEFTTNLPFYISALNLLTLHIQSNQHQPADPTPDPETPTTNPISQPAANRSPVSTTDTPFLPFFIKLRAWATYLTTRLAETTKTNENSEGVEEVDGIGVLDIYALEDAVGRAQRVLDQDGEGGEGM